MRKTKAYRQMDVLKALRKWAREEEHDRSDRFGQGRIREKGKAIFPNPHRSEK